MPKGRGMDYEAVIPYHIKDSDTLPWAIRGIREYTEASTITVVADQKCREEVDVNRLCENG